MCCCYDQMTEETYNHIFLVCPVAYQLWSILSMKALVTSPSNFLKEMIYKWWNVECSNKLKPLFNVVPCLILSVIWKRRNKVKHGVTYSIYSMVMEVSRNLHRLAKFRYPRLKNISKE